MANTFLQVRVNEEDKAKASAILEELGTNLSAVVNMMIRQIILTESIPFEIKKNPSIAAAPQAESFVHCYEENRDPVIDGIREEYEM